jgi:hypothetical protein
LEIFWDLGGFWADFKNFKWIFGIQNSSLKAFELFQTKVTIRDTKYFFLDLLGFLNSVFGDFGGFGGDF